MNVIWSPEALEDLEAAIDYLAERENDGARHAEGTRPACCLRLRVRASAPRAARSTELVAQLEEFIRFEAACCSFISMKLVMAADGQVALQMSAPAEAKPFIRLEFIDLPAAAAGSEVRSACGCKA